MSKPVTRRQNELLRGKNFKTLAQTLNLVSTEEVKLPGVKMYCVTMKQTFPRCSLGVSTVLMTNLSIGTFESPHTCRSRSSRHLGELCKRVASHLLSMNEIQCFKVINITFIHIVLLRSNSQSNTM